MIYKFQMANFLASVMVEKIKKMPNSKKPEHYKTMSYEDWCKYYFKLPKKILKNMYFSK